MTHMDLVVLFQKELGAMKEYVEAAENKEMNDLRSKGGLEKYP